MRRAACRRFRSGIARLAGLGWWCRPIVARRHAGAVSEPPSGGGPRVGQVGTGRAGADRTVEMFAELGMVFTDLAYRLADRAGHTDAGTLGCGCGASVAATQADSARQLSNQEIAFCVRLCGPLGVAEGARLLDVFLDLGEASPVRVLGARVEHLAGISECRARRAGRLPALDRRNSVLGGDEVQHVKLPAGVGEEPLEVPHAFQV